MVASAFQFILYPSCAPDCQYEDSLSGNRVQSLFVHFQDQPCVPDVGIGCSPSLNITFLTILSANIPSLRLICLGIIGQQVLTNFKSFSWFSRVASLRSE